MRALGHTKIDATEAARALNVPLADIMKAVLALEAKGVRVA
jgi:hypothetical protein